MKRCLANFPWDFPTEAFIANCRLYGVDAVNLSFKADTLEVGNYDQLEGIIDMCESHGVQVILNYHETTTGLSALGIRYDDGTLIPHLIGVWTPIVERFSGHPNLVGLRLIDEPNLGSVKELDMYTQLVGALKDIDDSLIWFCHAINVFRMGEQYYHLNPFKDTVPYNNMKLDGGMWLADYNEMFNFGLTDYVAANALFDDVVAALGYFDARVDVPSGVTAGMNEYYTEHQARRYFLKRLADWSRATGHVFTLYAADYQLGNDGLDVLEAIFGPVSRLTKIEIEARMDTAVEYIYRNW